MGNGLPGGSGGDHHAGGHRASAVGRRQGSGLGAMAFHVAAYVAALWSRSGKKRGQGFYGDGLCMGKL